MIANESERRPLMSQLEQTFQRLFKPKSDPKEIALGIAIAYVLTTVGLFVVTLMSGADGAVLRTLIMIMFLTLAPLISFAGLSATGSVAFTSVALLIYAGLWVFAVRKLSGLMLRVAAVILVGSWMMFGVWATESVY
jgi:hypothetical protein